MYLGFPSALVDALRCPKDSARLTYSGTAMHLREGSLSCEKCASLYEIRDGIVCMLEDSHLEPEMAREVGVRDENAEEYDRHFSERYEREVVPTTRAVGSLAGKTVIEYGAGTGRLTQILSKKSSFYLATDMSFRSLQALARKGIPETAGLVWTEAAGFKTAQNYFDRALTFQMIEHMPRPVRDRFYASVSNTLKKDGIFTASVYHQDLRRRSAGLPKDGTHDSGIYFHCFEKIEFAQELSHDFKVLFVRPTDVVVPLQSRLRLPVKLDGFFSRLFAYVPLLRDYGHIIIAKATQKL